MFFKVFGLTQNSFASRSKWLENVGGDNKQSFTIKGYSTSSHAAFNNIKILKDMFLA